MNREEEILKEKIFNTTLKIIELKNKQNDLKQLVGFPIKAAIITDNYLHYEIAEYISLIKFLLQELTELQNKSN